MLGALLRLRLAPPTHVVEGETGLVFLCAGAGGEEAEAVALVG